MTLPEFKPAYYFTSEIRWFFSGEIPAEMWQWFDPQGLARNEGERTDDYLVLPGCKTLGAKVREGRFEIKALRGSPIATDWPLGLLGNKEEWVKWSMAHSEAVQLLRSHREGDWMAVEKKRRARLFSLDENREKEPGSHIENGCLMELTALHVRGHRGWTLGLEAFGEEGLRQEGLERAASLLLSKTSPPFEAASAQPASYPEWLSRLASTG